MAPSPKASMSTRPFTPTQEQAEDLDHRTVGRDLQLAILHERLTLAATTKNRQHTLLVGARGSGKSHLLQVALYRVKSDLMIATKLAIVHVPEDAIGLISYVDLLRELAANMDIDIGRERNTSVLEKSLLIAANGRTIVIVIENLDKVFHALGEDGQRDLRSWVETSGQVLILATTPALFDAVRSRKRPWFGGLIEMPVEELAAKEGQELLIKLATDKSDKELVEALKSDWGKARIEAVRQLTAGSPRIWMIFSNCLSVDSLDELIPAVEGLVEGLVPYYQSLLWDLSPTQQAIVRQLAEGTSCALTASEIASETGLSQQTVSKQLGLLKESRWVHDMKQRGGDQRLTWYELREPMLRHHFQWRATGGEPLRLIVDLLKNWYSQSMLSRHLSLATPGAPFETYLADGLCLDPQAYDITMNAGTAISLHEVAREYMQGGSMGYPAEVGDETKAMQLHRELLADSTRMLGSDDKDTEEIRKKTKCLPRIVEARKGIMKLLDRALAGDQEALMRLPSELRPQVKSQHL